MHTGYDNFWMFQNSRHEPVLNLQKNDNHSQAILTDSCKQVPSGGHPSHLNSYLLPQNNIAGSYQNNQLRTPGSDCVWSSSVYPMPLRYPYVTNVQPQQAFLTQSSNVLCSSSTSQAQNNYGFRCSKSSNVNVSQVYRSNNEVNNYNNYENCAIARDNDNLKTQTPRIRVRDVFSLNNGTLCYQFLSNSSHQAQSKEPQACALNCSTVNYTTACTSETQNKVINHRKNSATYFAHTTAIEQPVQYTQNSVSIHQQNAEYSPENQFYMSGGKLVKQNVQLEASKTINSFPLLRQICSGNSQQLKGQMERSNSECVSENTRIKIMHKRHSFPASNLEGTSNLRSASLVEANKELIHKPSDLNNVTQIQHQESFIRINEACMSASGSATALTSNEVQSVISNEKGGSYDQINGQDFIVKISYPKILDCNSMSLNNFNSADKNSGLNLPTLSESNKKYCDEVNKSSPINSSYTRKNEVTDLSASQTSQGNFGNSLANSCAGSFPTMAQNCQAPSRKTFCPKEPFIDVNKENVLDFLNSNQTSENCPGNLSEVNVDKNESTLKEAMIPNCSPVLEQEIYNGSRETLSKTDKTCKGKALYEVIKMEANPDDENPEGSTMEDCEESEVQTESFVVDDNSFKTEAHEFVLASENPENISSQMKDAEDCEGEDNFNADSVSEKKIEGDKKETTEVVPPISHRSKINRDKLDMLIQFLEEDEPIKKKWEPPSKRKLESNDSPKKEADLNHNRRKLSKTCIVKNRNNKREMISYKIPRVELTKCSSQPSQILKSNSSKVEERKSSEFEDRFKNVPLTKKVEKISDKFSPEKNFKIQEDFLRTMRALQNLKTHFCVGCGLVSPIDSFWINVASSELRCFNCFSKISVRIKPNIFKSRPDFIGQFDVNPIRKGQPEKYDERITEGEVFTENNVGAADKSNGLSNIYCADMNSVNVKEAPRDELILRERETEGGRTRKEEVESSHTLRKQSAPSEYKVSEMGRSSHDQKRISAEHPIKINKSKEVSVAHKAEHSEVPPEAEGKENKRGDSSKQHRKGNNYKDGKFPEKNTKREEKRVNDRLEKCGKKTKEALVTHKDNDGEKIIKKDSKYEISEKSKAQRRSLERDTQQKTKPLEHAKPIELNSSYESKGKSVSTLSSVGNYKKADPMQLRKRKNSCENVGTNKVRIVEGIARREKIPTKITNSLKEDSAGPKNEISDSKRHRNAEENSTKGSFFKEGDLTRKEIKQPLESSEELIVKDVKKDAAQWKVKTYLAAKNRASDLPQKNSKDEQTVSRDASLDKQRSTSTDGSKSPRSSLQDLSKKETKHRSFEAENNDRKRPEEMGRKNPWEKTQKTSSTEKDNGEKMEIGERSQKSGGASKPLKEDQSNKVRSSPPSDKLKKKESREERKETKKPAEGRKDEKKFDKITRRKKVEKDWERLQGKWDKSRTENGGENDKMVAFERNRFEPLG